MDSMPDTPTAFLTLCYVGTRSDTLAQSWLPMADLLALVTDLVPDLAGCVQEEGSGVWEAKGSPTESDSQRFPAFVMQRLVFRGAVVADRSGELWRRDFQLLAGPLLACCGEGVDVALAPVPEGGYQGLVSDMDGTVLLDETLDQYAIGQGFGEDIIALTSRSMRGELDFAESLTARIRALAGQPLAPLEQIAKKAPLRPGGTWAFGRLVQAGWKLHLVSGGLEVVVDRVQERLGFQRGSGNYAVVKDGFLTGELRKPILRAETKRKILFTEGGGTARWMVALGDGANDIAMVREAGLGIAVGPLRPLDRQANGWITSGRLESLVLLAGASVPSLIARKDRFGAVPKPPT